MSILQGKRDQDTTSKPKYTMEGEGLKRKENRFLRRTKTNKHGKQGKGVQLQPIERTSNTIRLPKS